MSLKDKWFNSPSQYLIHVIIRYFMNYNVKLGSTDVNLVERHEIYGSDLENGAIFKLNINDQVQRFSIASAP